MPEAEHPEFDNFVKTVAQLRSPDGGCPWNRAQTHASIGDYMIEEAYEALDAIESGDVRHLREELGDVLLQVVLQSQIAADAGEFTIDDVCADIDAKMVRRHPHVFGNVKAENANEVADLWEQVKLAEKEAADAQRRQAAQTAQAGQPSQAMQTGSVAQTAQVAQSHESLLDSVPTHFPALLQAQKISRKAVAAGFEWETIEDVWDKVAEERAELEAAYKAAPKTPDGKLLSKDPAEREGLEGLEGRESAEPAASAAPAASTAASAAPERDPLVVAAELEFGDLLFALVNVARKMGIDAESALRASNAKFRRRFAEVERAAWEQGRAVEDLTFDEMERHWQQAKLRERAQ